MKNLMIFVLLWVSGLVTAQAAITFNGCHNLFEDQNFILNNTGTDGSGKKFYITTPVDGDQPCGGIGTCEFKIEWNTALSRWEFLADTGDGDFVNPYLIYYNSTGNNAAPNPPSNTFGTWVENITVTEGACGGNLSGSNSVMTGDVHNSMLGTGGWNKRKIQMFPNPVADYISISGVEDGKTIQIYSVNGQLLRTEDFNERINVNTLSAGVYILKVISGTKSSEFKFIKK